MICSGRCRGTLRIRRGRRHRAPQRLFRRRRRCSRHFFPDYRRSRQGSRFSHLRREVPEQAPRRHQQTGATEFRREFRPKRERPRHGHLRRRHRRRDETNRRRSRGRRRRLLQGHRQRRRRTCGQTDWRHRRLRFRNLGLVQEGDRSHRGSTPCEASQIFESGISVNFCNDSRRNKTAEPFSHPAFFFNDHFPT